MDISDDDILNNGIMLTFFSNLITHTLVTPTRYI